MKVNAWAVYMQRSILKKETKKPAVEGSGLQIQSRGKEETNASYSIPYLYSVSGLLNLA
jgi:hypothetical protein